MNAQSEGDHGERVLVAGASGFIGRRLTANLVKAGYLVRALVHRPSASAPVAGVECVVGDITRPETCRGVERDVNIIVNCAGCLGKWGMDPECIRVVNAEGATQLLSGFGSQPPMRFIHLSTVGVTGPLGTDIGSEQTRCSPRGVYQQSKYAGEQGILQAGVECGIPVVVIRPSFTYGPGDSHKLALFRAIKRGRFAFIGHGTALLHPVFVEDLVAGIMLAITHGAAGGVYNVGGAEPVSVRRLVHSIADEVGVTRPILSIPTFAATALAACCEALARATGIQPILSRSRVDLMSGGYGYDITHARRELGYTPQYDLESGISRTVDDYRASGWL